jgi:beta-glucosidase/6-phospho-beta-glucosidase/beta-galactosidase
MVCSLPRPRLRQVCAWAVKFYRAMDVGPSNLAKSTDNEWSCSVAHNLILAHAYTVQAFADFRGHGVHTNLKIGITLNTGWYMPWDDAPESK